MDARWFAFSTCSSSSIVGYKHILEIGPLLGMDGLNHLWSIWLAVLSRPGLPTRESLVGQVVREPPRWPESAALRGDATNDFYRLLHLEIALKLSTGCISIHDGYSSTCLAQSKARLIFNTSTGKHEGSDGVN